MSDSLSGKIAEGKSVIWGTRLQPMGFSTNIGCFTKHSSALEWRTEKIMWVVFISILHAGKGLTTRLFVYCTGALIGCCWGKNENRNLKNRREFLNKLTDSRLTCGPIESMGNRVLFCNQKQSVHQSLFLKDSKRIIKATENGVMTSRQTIGYWLQICLIFCSVLMFVPAI